MKYKYLNDFSFLQIINELQVKEQFVRIVLLTFSTEKPITEIQGRVKNGSYNLNGKSSVRRTAQFSMVADNDGDVTNAANLISINKKVDLEIGYTNTTDKYKEYPIIWFPLGRYVITEAQVNRGKENITISVNLKDKMCLMNGECGGTIPAAATLSEYDIVNAQGLYETQKITIVQLIRELVNHYGNEQLGKIYINDLDTRVKQVVMWAGDVPLYLVKTQNPVTREESYLYTLTITPEQEETAITLKYGDDIGFIYTDFTYPGQLTAVAGDTVCTILDKIVSVLGNFEYFYDLDGNFIFQEIKNNLNTSKTTVELGKTVNSDYLIDLSNGIAEYDFTNSKLITTISNNPHYNNIKNDFMVWGIRKDATGKNYPIRFHLSIDAKPDVKAFQEQYTDGYVVYMYTDELGVKRAKVPIPITKTLNGDFIPTAGVEDYLYIDQYNTLYTWTLDERLPDISPKTAGQMTFVETIIPGGCPRKGGVVGWHYRSMGLIYKCVQASTDTTDCVYEESEDPYRRTVLTIDDNTDWRTILYLQGLVAEPNGTDYNYYYSELINEWPKMYDIENQEWIVDLKTVNFYLDFIDTSTALGALSVENIGRRTIVIDNKDINCIFEEDLADRDCILIRTDSCDTDLLQKECRARGQRYSLVESAIYDNIITGGSANSAYVMIKDLLYQYTNYNETVAISILPIFYLEPNTRVTIQDTKTGVYGDYMINTISCSLDISGMMSISCTRVLEKI